MSFQAGQIVGEYQIVRALGQGGLGAVYEAVHLISQRAEAMKVMLPERTGAKELTERFRREIQLLASLTHPNIASLHNAFHFEDQLIMVMELVAGEDLRSRSRKAPVPLAMVLGYTTQILSALDYAHCRGVVHRDIKPANLMVSHAGLIKVLDFGIATTQGAADLTLAGAVIGSPLHMSPEQIRGEKATAQSDIYSLGVTLYELIAGQPPFSGATTYEVMMAHLNRLPVPLSQLRPDLPVSLANAIARAMQKEPAERFATAAEFLSALPPQITADAGPTAVIPQATRMQPTITERTPRSITGSTDRPAEQLVRHLATFIGPIAKVVVNRLANQYTDLDRLYAEAAKQIENEADRKKFLRTRPPP